MKKHIVRGSFILEEGVGRAEELFGSTDLDNDTILKKYLTKDLYELYIS